MSSYRAFTPDDAATAAEAALSQSASAPVSIGDVQNLGSDKRRNIVLRASAVERGRAPRPIIVKATRDAAYDPSAPNLFAISGLVKEWAATTLLAKRRLGRREGGTLLAADLQRGVLVFEDLGQGLPSLVRPLTEGSAADAEAALTASAQSLAHLHAATLGCETDHADIVRAAFPAATVQSSARNWIEGTALKVPALLGGNLPAEELTLMAGRLQAPGPWSALVHGDPCPDNVLLAPGGTARLIDFEFASPGHALMDAAYWRMGFPTCWCAGRLPDPVADRIDRAYRAILAEAAPIAADDDAFLLESTIIAAAWLLGSLAWLLEEALREDTTWGIATRRSRILHYLDVAIRATAGAEILPETRRAAAAWRDDLKARWPSSSPLAPYPAFARQPA